MQAALWGAAGQPGSLGCCVQSIADQERLNEGPGGHGWVGGGGGNGVEEGFRKAIGPEGETGNNGRV